MKILSFTRFLTEESAGYAKLKSKKFRKIRFNEAEKSIMTDEENAAISGVSLYIEEDPEMYDESYYKMFNETKTQRSLFVGDKEDFEVFYSFSGAVRGDRRYGNANWSARFLYEFLCNRFNQGERFIDSYLNRVFTYRPVYVALKETVDKIQSSIENRWNDGNLKGGQWASFYKFQTEEMSFLQSSLEKFSREIRQDIILCLSNGTIPLRFSLSSVTLQKRASIGLGSTPFYATTWLINQIEVHVILGNSDTGRLFYSDSYKGA